MIKVAKNCLLIETVIEKGVSGSGNNTLTLETCCSEAHSGPCSQSPSPTAGLPCMCIAVMLVLRIKATPIPLTSFVDLLHEGIRDSVQVLTHIHAYPYFVPQN